MHCLIVIIYMSQRQFHSTTGWGFFVFKQDNTAFPVRSRKQFHCKRWLLPAVPWFKRYELCYHEVIIGHGFYRQSRTVYRRRVEGKTKHWFFRNISLAYIRKSISSWRKKYFIASLACREARMIISRTMDSKPKGLFSGPTHIIENLLLDYRFNQWLWNFRCPNIRRVC